MAGPHDSGTAAQIGGYLGAGAKSQVALHDERPL